jgi:uncharacterized membrane protein
MLHLSASLWCYGEIARLEKYGTEKLKSGFDKFRNTLHARIRP